jgi:hypothetical protein
MFSEDKPADLDVATIMNGHGLPALQVRALQLYPAGVDSSCMW